MNTDKAITVLVVLMIAGLGACAQTSLSKKPQVMESQLGTAWVESAAEYDALTLQAYQNATGHLDALIADENSSALPGYEGKTNLPPAVILDVDETSVSNVEFQAEIKGNFSHEAFDYWQQNNQARRIKGAPEFIQAAREKGVTVFFITNRPCHERDFTKGPCPQEAITLKNLAEAGIKTDAEHLMLVGEKPEWNREKRFRQELVAKGYRVIMLIGDDLGDFLPCIRAKPVAPCPAATAEARDRMTMEFSEYWGVRWHILPNPMHGSWSSFIPGDGG
ncbi:MAG: HAD family acid phosphatase [Lysobacterales bacterium]|jgi:acid phosphatase